MRLATFVISLYSETLIFFVCQLMSQDKSLHPRGGGGGENRFVDPSHSSPTGVKHSPTTKEIFLKHVLKWTSKCMFQIDYQDTFFRFFSVQIWSRSQGEREREVGLIKIVRYRRAVCITRLWEHHIGCLRWRARTGLSLSLVWNNS